MSSRILLTGASGFLGKEIFDFFINKKYSIYTLGRANCNNLVCDLSREVPKISSEEKFDTVVHVAGKAHIVPKTETERQAFFDVNHNGTLNLLKALKSNLPKRIIFISTVAVYGVDSGDAIDENHPLNGDTPYAISKILAEKEVLDFGNNNNVKTVILRLPLITGVNPSGNLGEMIAAIRKGYYFRIGNGEARRTIISSEEVANVIEIMMEKEGVFNIADSKYPTIKEIDQHIGRVYEKKIKVLPRFVFRVLSLIGDVFSFFPLNSIKYSKLTKSLIFSNEKILKETKWRPKDCLKELK